ncbi:hypothetical protein FRC04_001454 [Tulasnella sp. 424]|nr:hypothetical protein FRC04_001454 [Tulasnella sp. 424]
MRDFSELWSQSPPLSFLSQFFEKVANEVDAEEFSRLDLHHSMFTAALDGLFPPPATDAIHNALRVREGYAQPAVLDVGTGSGAWCIDMAKAFPDAAVIGMDLVPVKSSSVPPASCRFDVGNADTDLAKMYKAESFNFIHARSMMQGVKDFPSFIRNIQRMLRPGGVSVIMDGPLTTWDEDRQSIEYKEEGQPGFSWFRKTLYHMREVLITRNPNVELIYSLPDCVRDMGDDIWEKVETFYLFIPVGNFDSPTISPSERLGGKLLAENFSRLPDSIRPMLLSSSLTPEGVDRLAAGLRAELKEPKVKQFAQLIYTWAVKK